jgi:hypothetical protein
LQIIGEAKLANGETLVRTARGNGMVVDVQGGTGIQTAGGVVGQKPVTAPWLNLTLPVALMGRPSGQLAVKQVNRIRMEQGDQYDFEWTFVPMRPEAKAPERVNVEVVGMRDQRIINMTPAGPNGKPGKFSVTTTRATQPGSYDLFINARLMIDGQAETIASRPIAVQVEEVSREVASSN